MSLFQQNNINYIHEILATTFHKTLNSQCLLYSVVVCTCVSVNTLILYFILLLGNLYLECGKMHRVVVTDVIDLRNISLQLYSKDLLNLMNKIG